MSDNDADDEQQQQLPQQQQQPAAAHVPFGDGAPAESTIKRLATKLRNRDISMEFLVARYGKRVAMAVDECRIYGLEAAKVMDHRWKFFSSREYTCEDRFRRTHVARGQQGDCRPTASSSHEEIADPLPASSSHEEIADPLPASMPTMASDAEAAEMLELVQMPAMEALLGSARAPRIAAVASAASRTELDELDADAYWQMRERLEALQGSAMAPRIAAVASAASRTALVGRVESAPPPEAVPPTELADANREPPPAAKKARATI